MPNAPDTNPWRRLANARRYSWQGIAACYRHEQAFRQEAWVLLLAVPLGHWLGDDGVERALLVGSWLLLSSIQRKMQLLVLMDRLTIEVQQARPVPAHAFPPAFEVRAVEHLRRQASVEKAVQFLFIDQQVASP